MTTGLVVVNGKQEERQLASKAGCLYRRDTADSRTLSEIPKSYGWLSLAGERVLDIGAHIGGFSRYALDRDAQSVVSVEPDPCNFALLQQNTRDTRSHLINAAMVRRADGPVNLYYTKRGFSHGMNSITPFRGRSSIEVHSISFDMVLSTFHPTVIKVDCEGAEYDFLDGRELPEYVTQVAAELHFSKHEWRVSLGPKLIESFRGWETVVKPTIGENNWATIAGWRRSP